MIGSGKFRAMLVLLGALLIANLAVSLFPRPSTSYAQQYGRAKYMYKVVHVAADEQSVQTVVDLFARDGWEVEAYSNEILILKK